MAAPTFPVGQPITQSDLAWWQATRPLMAATGSGGQAIPSGVWTAVAYGSPSIDRDGGATGTGYTIGRTTGSVYEVGASVTFPASAAGTMRAVRLRRDGATVPGGLIALPATGGAPCTVVVPPTPVVAWSAADTVTVEAFQDTGGALTTTGVPLVTVEYAGSAGLLTDPAAALYSASTLPVIQTQIRFGGVWTDVSAWVDPSTDMSYVFGRATEFDLVGPGTLTVALVNDGRFTPDNPSSPYSPSVIEGAYLKQTIIYGTGTSALFFGRITSWVPSFPEQGVTSLCTVTATDILADLEAVTFIDRWTSEAAAIARAAGSWCDIPVIAGDATTTSLANAGVTSGTLGAIAVYGGSYGAPSGINLAAAWTGTGSQITVTPQAGPQVIQFWVQIPSDVLPATLGAAEHTTTVSAAGGPLFSVSIAVTYVASTPPEVDLQVRQGLGPTVLGTLQTYANDDAWRQIVLTPTPGTPTSTTVTAYGSAGTVVASLSVAYDMRTATSINFGSTKIVTGGIVVSGATTPVAALRAVPGQNDTVTNTVAALASYLPNVTTGWNTIGASATTTVIGEPVWAGKTGLNVLQQIASTINGVAYGGPDGQVTLATFDVTWPVTSTATLQVAGDLDPTHPPTLQRQAAVRPTRVTVTYAGGKTTTVTDTAAEAAGHPVVSKTLDTCAPDLATATQLGQNAMIVQQGLRYSQVTVDLVTAASNLWAAFLALIPTGRVTVAGLTASYSGATSVDVYVQGWTLAVNPGAMKYVLDTSPTSPSLYQAGAWDVSTWDSPSATWR